MRAVQDWELESLMTFMDTIYGTPIRGIEENKMCWKPDIKKGFKVNDYYRLLGGTSDQYLPWKSIWKPNVPPIVAFCIWNVGLGKILTIDNKTVDWLSALIQ